ncbi:putative nucleic acid-binding protein [Herbihabitans rhizosphaerae]|uniref:Ribonuclease VapC n=1 Tax=Herbihabitans rhizosphaerae TaxID=1872711 RepID=A0A4Q7KK02_9PSEU|nr:type II toxin-antitoxin system VapC family toxin [Herbihabitans rhizosphaerae]RZS36879.1 putative nucleic acid-binding protein [Herbihabitans rhizosphaerae]
MTDLVIDASAFVFAKAEQHTAAVAMNDRFDDTVCHAPHVVDAEVGHALRKLERVGEIGHELAASALSDLWWTIDERYPHTGALTDLAWQMRQYMSFYDGLYVALACLLDVPLLTADARLAKAAADLPCEVELITA